MSVALVLIALAAAPRGEPLRVRATEAIGPCVRSAAASYQRTAGAPVAVDEGPWRDATEADVLVAVSVEMTRALEGGWAANGSDVDVAKVPWVLARTTQARSRSLDDVESSGDEVWVFGGPLGRDARQALSSLESERVHETSDLAQLRSAPLAVVPLSLAGGRATGPLDVPPLVVQAAVASRSARADAARAFVRFLSTEAGQQAFASCSPSTP